MIFLHYLKVAWRNLLKYKVQSVISIVGLGIGFCCFALSLLWIKHETTFDNFHRGADRIYLVRHMSEMADNGISSTTPYPLAAYLKENLPEIENVATGTSWLNDVIYEGQVFNCYVARGDSNFVNMFDITLLSGNMDFLQWENRKVAITAEFAKKLFGDEDPLGKEIEIYKEKRTICAVINAWPKHSNIAVDIFGGVYIDMEWTSSFYNTFIRLKENVDINEFTKKMDGLVIKPNDFQIFKNIIITPLTRLRYDNPLAETEIKFDHIRLFALLGGLVIICSLFNYLTLLVSRFIMRRKELALRNVCGSSRREIFMLLSVEFVMILILALLFGMVMIELFFSSFIELACINVESIGFYSEIIVYAIGIMLVSFVLFIVLLSVFYRNTLNTSIRKSRRGIFRKLSTVSQFIISIGVIFCTIVIMKQIYHLNNTDIGVDYKNTGSVSIYPSVDVDALARQVAQIPEIEASLVTTNILFPKSVRSFYNLKSWEDRTPDTDENRVTVETIDVSEEYLKFYNLRLSEGEWLKDNDPKEYVMISESAAKAFGWHQPLGKTINLHDEGILKVKGVIKDVYNISLTIIPIPVLFKRSDRTSESYSILFRFQEGRWDSCCEKLVELTKREYPDADIHIHNAEEEYNRNMTSERALIKILVFASVVCIIISLFGLFSLASLTCEERQKEIAIRKINGANMWNISQMYLREYFLLLFISALIAFPVGYLIMRTWVEQYIKQTAISIWIYPAILIALAIVVLLCVGWRIYKAAIQNPAEIIKKGDQ